ncbi:MAG: hypothetical protein QXF56_04350 [Candidatus Micrarchaeia archaeon]
MKKYIIGLLLLSLMWFGCTATGGTLTVKPACSSGAVSSEFETYWGNWQSLSILAASTVFLVAAFVYTLGHVLVHRKVTLWAKEQMEEAILAMAITIFVIGFVSFLCSLDLNTLGIDTGCTGDNCNMINVAFGYLSDFYSTIMTGYVTVAGLNAVMSSVATMTIGKAPGGVGVMISPLAVFSDISSSLTMAMIVLMTSAIMVLTQMVLLKMMESLFVILFPIGVLLRSFGATRGFGGGLIALAIGFFFFYPLLAVLFYGAVLGDVQMSYEGMSDSFKESGLSPTDPSWFTGNPLSEFFVGFIGKTIVGAIFMPLVMFMILISFVKGLSYALGEEVDVSNLTRLI